jgi:histidine phosphotransfer protein HptB
MASFLSLVNREELETVLRHWIAQADIGRASPAVTPRAGEGINEAPVEDPIDPTAWAELKQLSDEGSDFLLTLVALFLEETPQRLKDIGTALVLEDGTALSRTAHLLNGSCGNIGARRMCNLCADLQAYGQARDFSRTGPMLLKLEEEFEQVRRRLLAECGP